MESILKTFKSVAKVPSITCARIINIDKNKNYVTVYSWWSEKCLEKGKSVKFLQSHLINTSNKDIISFIPVDCTETISSFSPRQELRALIRDAPPSDNGPKKLSQHLEIWKQSNLHVVADLSAMDVHGDVYTDSEFSCFEWSPCEKKLLYIAEKKVPKSEPFYKPKPQPTDDDTSSSDSKITKGEEHIFKEEWGEQLVGKHQPVVVVFDVEAEKIILPSGIPSNFSAGQAVWASDGGIVGVVWENEPRRLGLMYCTNRPSYIFHLDPNGKFNILSEKNNNAVRSPRFSPDGKHLIWLERPAGGPHHGAQRLVKYCWSSGNVETVVDIVHNKLENVDPVYFRGLFNQSLPKNCWMSDNIHVLLSTPGPICITSCIINTETKAITLLKAPNDNVGDVVGGTSLSVLDYRDGYVVCVRSNLKYPSCLLIGKFTSLNDGNIEWLSLTDWNVFPGLEDVEGRVHYTQAKYNVSDTINEINALYLKPFSKPDKKIPLIVWPHGGPHTNFVNAFSPCAAFFALLGYGVVMVNYRGSTGLGQDYVDFLLGKIGDCDVKDVHQVAEELCNLEFTNFDSCRKVLFGGSHGGFLITHLSGQYPNSYKVVVSLNPVTDASSMISLTDIPDWCAVESGNPYSPLGDISKDHFNKMYNASPIRYVDKVKAPTLLLLGKKDLRVPCYQGLQYFYRLKARNVKTKLLIYDDNHSLGTVPVEMDSLVNSVLWFREHLG